MIRWEFRKQGLTWKSRIEYNESQILSSICRNPLPNLVDSKRHHSTIGMESSLNRMMNIQSHFEHLKERYGKHAAKELLDL